MKVKCRGYQGTLIKLDTIMLFRRGRNREVIRVPKSVVTIEIDGTTMVQLSEVADSEIEVIHED